MTLKHLTPAERPQTDDGKRRIRSTIQFPYSDLDDACAVAEAVQQNVGAGRCTEAQLAAWLEHDSVNSGTYRQKLSAARIFGLIENEKGSISLTPLGREIVDPASNKRARVRAFLAVPLYKAVFEKYNGMLLPPDVGIEHQMEELGVSPNIKDKARQAFQRSAQQAGFFHAGRTRLVLPADMPAPVVAQTAPEPHAQVEVDRKAPIPPAVDRAPSNGHGGGGAGGPTGIDPSIEIFIEELPKPGAVWPQNERAQWLRLIGKAFNRVYKDA
jgi:hypothetical protein